MIVKVPIYVEIPEFRGDELAPYVIRLNSVLTKRLKGQNVYNKEIIIDSIRLIDVLGDFKVITREQALDSLRTKK